MIKTRFSNSELSLYNKELMMSCVDDVLVVVNVVCPVTIRTRRPGMYLPFTNM